jgi:hypothetical protein
VLICKLFTSQRRADDSPHDSGQPSLYADRPVDRGTLLRESINIKFPDSKYSDNGEYAMLFDFLVSVSILGVAGIGIAVLFVAAEKLKDFN